MSKLPAREQKFLELVGYYEMVKDKAEEVRKELEAVMVDLGEETYLQDPTSLVVYKVVSPKGTFVPYRSVDYVRTALEGERAGTLSKKEAEEQGFTLKK